MKFLKPFHRKWIIGIILWLVIVFFAIFKLPNITNLITNNGQPQFDHSSQITQADQMQNKWGRNLNGATRVSLVYHTSSNQAITTQQQNNINKAINKLAKQAKHYGIVRITDVNSNPNGTLQLLSQDKTTEIVNLYVSKNVTTNTYWADEINALTQVSGVDNYVTNQNILNRQNNQKVVSLTRLMTIIALLLSLVVMGLLFRSLVAPIISVLSLGISYVTSLSIITNFVTHDRMPFFSYTPIITLLITVILGTIFNFLLYRQTVINWGQYRDSFTPVWQAIKKYTAMLLWSSAIIIVTFVGFYYIKFSPFRSLVSVAITIIVLVAVTMTLTPILVALIGNKLIWPSHHVKADTNHKLWNHLTRFSLWQPIAGLLVVLYVVGPFVYSYRQSLNYSGAEATRSTSQAAIGSQVLQAHFTNGKATPLTIYIKNNQSLDNQTDLQQIDALTNKLKSMPGINAVYSVTQPSGVPISKYYVYNQLNIITTTVNGTQKKLHSISNDVKSGKKNFKVSELDKQIKNLDKARSVTDQLASSNSQINSQISQTTGGATSSQKTSSKQNIAAYQQRISELSQGLSQAQQTLAKLATKSQNANAYVSTVASNLSTYKQQLNLVKSQLDNINQKAQAVNSTLNGAYDYVQGLAHSTAANVYYITGNQIADTDFQQSLFNYTSQNMKMTQIEVIFNNDPNHGSVVYNTNKLRNEIKTQLQGTAMANATIVTTGQPEVQAELQTQFKHSIQTAILIIAIVSLLGLFFLSRAILQPLYWVAIFILSAVSGIQITSIILKVTTGTGALNWQAEVIMIALLTAIGVWQLVPLAIAYRERKNSIIDWLKPALTSLGQMVRYLWVIVIAIVLSCFFRATLSVMATGSVIILTVIIFNLVLPVLVSSLGKLAETLPKTNFRKRK